MASRQCSDGIRQRHEGKMPPEEPRQFHHQCEASVAAVLLRRPATLPLGLALSAIAHELIFTPPEALMIQFRPFFITLALLSVCFGALKTLVATGRRP